MNLLICGSRGIDEYKIIEAAIAHFELEGKITTITSGGARGADTLAEKYADNHSIPKVIIKADWATHGKGAGYIRNAEMINSGVDAVLALWDGQSRGTRNTLELADKKEIKKYIYLC
jgi:hypothetical protein